MFKTSEENIPQIKAAVKKFGSVWFHGCGNMYKSDYHSDNRQKFTNPSSEEAIYRIKFTSVDQVPATVEQLNKLLMASRSQEIVAERMNKVASSIDTITVEDEEDDDEAKLKAMIAAEEKAKKEAEEKANQGQK